ncbi:polyketide synthase [Massilia sp. MB5]|uniref:beta-ketoacyl [acyl carrier protein] synthase domain-containing protein n=1 Tax=Massilia sp. MB5 TaxID=2919578 RepID=UPI001F11438D|nr:polyketide synthase [Massilia sp. MB5]UMR29441.1 polyketide synthase [Massilia sp. MB5]
MLGEGAGMVLLKPLAAAEADGDRIYAVLKAVSVNNDGRTAGPASPNLAAHKRLLEQTLRRSGLAAADIGHIEANGSGTAMTDLLELKAISAVYGGAARRCSLGSVKPNIGHPLCAEGIAALIKVVLMLHHRQGVPFLSGQVPLPHFALADSPFFFHRATAALDGALPAAALNCFADGGTNVHAILQAWHAGALARRAPLTPPQRRPAAPQPQPGGNIWKRYSTQESLENA